MTDPALIEAFRKQTRTVLASGDAAAFLGLWAAWEVQAGVCRDDLVDVLKEFGRDEPV